MIIDELVAFSNFYGSDVELVLAGGGNTSAKDGDVMYIKGSGTRLATITADGFVKMDRKKLAAIFTKEYPSDDKTREAMSLKDLNDAKLPGQDDKRPSVETTLHSLFAYTFVLHLHPSNVNALTCSKNGKEKAKELFGESVLWVDACRPGYILAKNCYDILSDYKKKTGEDADMLLLENHGIFIAANDVSLLGEKLNSVLRKINSEIKETPDFSTGDYDGEKSSRAFNIISDKFGDDAVITYEPSKAALEFSADEKSANVLMKSFTPDHIVYCKAKPIYVENENEIPAAVDAYKDKNGYLPKIIMVKECGFYAVDFSVKGSETVSMLFNDAIKIAVLSRSFGGASYMSDDLTDFIVNWEAESYRSKQN